MDYVNHEYHQEFIPGAVQSNSLIGRTSMQGQSRPLSSLHWPIPILLLSSSERSVRYMSTSSTCGRCSSLCVSCKEMPFLFLTAPFRRLLIQRLKNHAGVDCWEKGSRYMLYSFTTNTEVYTWNTFNRKLLIHLMACTPLVTKHIPNSYI